MLSQGDLRKFYISLRLPLGIPITVEFLNYKIVQLKFTPAQQ